MLILTRKIGETIIIDDNITITILGRKSKHVRIGIGAPKHIPVHREEIYQRIQRKQQHQTGENPNAPFSPISTKT